VLLQTAIVPVRSANRKNMINARVLLDSASQSTSMTTKLAQQLNLPCEYEEYLSVATFGVEKTRSVDTLCCTLSIAVKGWFLLITFS